MDTFALLLRLSLRNLFRHRRRNLLMLSALVLAIASVVVVNALIRGMQQDLADSTVSNLTGHLAVHAPGYLDDPSIERGFAPENSRAIEGIQTNLLAGWAARIRVPASIMSERETRGIELVGVDPQQESISFLDRAQINGEGLAGPADKRVLIGQELADRLKTRVGKRLVIITQGSDGTNREAGFRIAGTYDIDAEGLEQSVVFTGRDYLQELLDTELITEVSVRLTQEPADNTLQAALSAQLDGLDVQSWQQLEPQSAAMYAMAETGIYIWFLILMSALTFGLVNTLVTAVMERIKELGMLRALGMRPAQVVSQVVLECNALMLVGVALGCLLGALAVFWLRDGIDLSQWAQGVQGIGMRATLTPRLLLSDIWLVSGMSLVLGLLASFYPALRAVKVKPLEALGR